MQILDSRFYVIGSRYRAMDRRSYALYLDLYLQDLGMDPRIIGSRIVDPRSYNPRTLSQILGSISWIVDPMIQIQDLDLHSMDRRSIDVRSRIQDLGSTMQILDSRFHDIGSIESRIIDPRFYRSLSLGYRSQIYTLQTLGQILDPSMDLGLYHGS